MKRSDAAFVRDSVDVAGEGVGEDAAAGLEGAVLVEDLDLRVLRDVGGFT